MLYVTQTMVPAADDRPPRWLLLIHQIPPQPAYFRAKVGRRIQRLGAVAIKNSVYVTPLLDATQEDLQWVAREIVSDGGEATLCKAEFVEGLRDDQIEALFHAARDADYAQIAEEARELTTGLPPRLAKDDERRGELETQLGRLQKRLGEVGAIDFFGAPGRVAAEAALASFGRRLERGQKAADEGGDLTPEAYRNRTWVTRKNVHVDRIGCAWLVHRFIDPDARFKFVAAQGYRAAQGEVTFDMYEADFTHVGDQCSFETLVERFNLREAGLAPLAEIIHDIDVKDGKFGRAEAPGVAAVIAGIALAEREDEARVTVGGRIFDALLQLYRRKR
ncbi:MAG TPA: chromate resistance protein ChrB domain-containing protein [Polyangiaceae bacterium]|nr:chromate resistance protein ChrB domain-containing protein [Polyangiaceae bacterium]